jgi:hypothetical protein
MRCIPLLLALALAATTAHAQGVFRSVMPDGKIVYGDKPALGAKESKEVNLPPPNIMAAPPAPASPPAGSAEPPTLKGDSNADVVAARNKLDAAKKALETGSEQREGDRIGVAKGGGATSRLSDAYLQRVKALEDAVASAQAQLDAAQRAAR